MKNLILPAILILLLFSCKKDKNETPIQQSTPFLSSNQYFPMAVGNYWIYQNVTIDSNGAETVNPILDSVYISKDTVLNGKTYFEVCGIAWLNMPSAKSYCRDSLGFVVASGGWRMYAPAYYTDTLFAIDYGNGWSECYMMKHLDSLVYVPAGGFYTSNNENDNYYPPTYAWGNMRIAYTLYSRYVGIVKQRDYWTGSPDYLEGRLVRYYVQ